MTSLCNLWLKQKRMEDVPFSGPIQCETLSSCTRCTEKSQVSLEVQDGNGGSARSRHRICNLYLEGEKLSADREANATFITSFSGFVEDHYLIFSCDEAGLNFRLSDKTLAASFEMSAYGRKVSKESHNQCLCKCCRHCQVTSPRCWKSETSKVLWV